MNTEAILLNLTHNSVPLLCILMAGILAYKEKEGWGWMLFIAVISFGYVQAS